MSCNELLTFENKIVADLQDFSGFASILFQEELGFDFFQNIVI